jgi:hypothetical protein
MRVLRMYGLALSVVSGEVVVDRYRYRAQPARTVKLEKLHQLTRF